MVYIKESYQELKSKLETDTNNFESLILNLKYEIRRERDQKHEIILQNE